VAFDVGSGRIEGGGLAGRGRREAQRPRAAAGGRPPGRRGRTAARRSAAGRICPGGQLTARSISRTTLTNPRQTHPSSPVSTASSAASAAASPRSARERHREQERGQRRFSAPHFLHITMAPFSPCRRASRTRRALPVRPPSAVRARARTDSTSLRTAARAVGGPAPKCPGPVESATPVPASSCVKPVMPSSRGSRRVPTGGCAAGELRVLGRSGCLSRRSDRTPTATRPPAGSR
jgi:hypothetical protein